MTGVTSRLVKQFRFFKRVFKLAYSEHEAEDLLLAIKQRGNLRKNMIKAKKLINTAEEAHHIIPIESIKQCKLAQKAVLGKFDINAAENGIAFSIKMHKLHHARLENYNRYVLGELLHLESKLPKGISNKDAAKEVKKLMITLEKSF